MNNSQNSNNSNNNKGVGSGMDQYSVSRQQQQQDDSPYYKSSAPSISLPKGGGALKGIDEKFTVNAVNGTAGVEIPLPLTPGRGGFTPALSLSYNSGSGNSAFGLGWNLGLPSIQRRTDKQLPQYKDHIDSDTFLLAGAEDMVPELDANGNKVVITDGNYTIKRYHPRIEGLWARIEWIKQNNTSGSWWRVTTKDNLVTWYGLTKAGRIANPQYPGLIFEWLPELVTDHKGNIQQYYYIKENDDNIPNSGYERNRLNGNMPCTNTYLSKVCYGNRVPWYLDSSTVWAPTLPDADGTNLHWMFTMVVDYGNYSSEHYTPTPDQSWPCRKDPFSDYHAGFDIRTRRLGRRFLMFHRFDELNNGDYTLVHAVELSYRYDESTDTLTQPDYITQVVSRGYKLKDGTYYNKALPAVTYQYQELAWDTTIHTVSRTDFMGAPQGLTGPYQWMDFDGEGINGILTEQSGAWWYKSNLGEGTFSPMNRIAEKPNYQGLGQGLQWQDLDADGRRQVTASAPTPGYWELEGPNAYTDQKRKWNGFKAFKKNINIDWNSPYTKMLDLNGDGRSDVLLTEDRVWTWYENEGTDGWDTGGQAPIFTDENKGPVLLLRDNIQSIFLADISGDGLTDFVRIRNGEVAYWPNMGYGRFGAKVTMQAAPTFQHPDIFNPLYLTLADISGSGSADLIYTGRTKSLAWLNLSGNGWSEAKQIPTMPPTNAQTKLAVTDFLGTGTSCLVWSSPLPKDQNMPIQYIDLMGSKKPYLMSSYSNGMGKTVTLTYKTSTQYYLADKKVGIQWATKLPFPVHCVETITTTDSVSQTTYAQSYKYRHGYYDSPEREFRGFGYVETLDTDTAVISLNPPSSSLTPPSSSLNQSPVLTKTWNHTGAWRYSPSLIDVFKTEFYPFEGWDDVKNIATLPTGLNPIEYREAIRALKGSPLRQEVYALDGTDKEGIPYTVTATTYLVKEIQPIGNNKYASFLNLQQESIAFNCERDSKDPRILHQLTLDTDAYGNILQSASVAYPRLHTDSSLPTVVQQEQAKRHITESKAVYTNDITTGNAAYRLRVGYEKQDYEANLSAPQAALYTLIELKTGLDAATSVDFTIPPTIGEKRIIEHSKAQFLADDAATVLDFGVLESLAIPYNSYTLAFTPDVLTHLYDGLVTDAMLSEGAYLDLNGDGNRWVTGGTATYNNPQANFYTPQIFTDPWGNSTKVAYLSDYWLLPESVTDALGNTNTVKEYDFITLQPLQMVDANNNISAIIYDALGMPVAMALMGKGSEADSLAGIDPESPTDIANQAAFWQDPESYDRALLQKATWRCVYNLDSTPTAVGMMVRQKHATDDPNTELSPVLRLTYTDGLGRIIMDKVQCEPTEVSSPQSSSLNPQSSNLNPESSSVLTPQSSTLIATWVGSGRTIYNNKGAAVMQFEPYFSATHLCDTAEQAAADGVSPLIYLDPLGRNYRTDLPDGSFTKTEWTAWQQLVWDNNDTVLDSQWYADRINGDMGPEEQDAAEKAAAHANTPTLILTDTLARGFYTRQYLTDYNPQPSPLTPEYIDSYEILDIDSDRLAVIDGRGLQPLTYRYNMIKAPGYELSLDGGLSRVLVDVAGQPLYNWDPDGRVFDIQYDPLRRPLQKTVTESSNTTTLEVYVYGEGQTDDQQNNLRGEVYRVYDGAGTVTTPQYDFKGNPLLQQRVYTEDATQQPDWTNTTTVPMETDVYATSITYDALNRPITQTTPDSGNTNYAYDRGGLLYSVDVDNVHGLDSGVTNSIAYNAKGQRLKTQLANGSTTTYEYDANTFRVTNIKTTRQSDSAILQDLYYWYDPVGNVTMQKDAAQQTVFFNGAIAKPENDYTYDALYRLIQAGGREIAGNDSAPDYNDSSRMGFVPVPIASTDTAKMRPYIQYYTYDAVGNFVEMQHTTSGGTGAWTRTYTTDSASNRLNSTVIGNGTPESYSYDARGNIVSGFIHLQSMSYNALNRLEVVVINSFTTAYYQYDSQGQRVRKTVVNTNSNQTETRKYVSEWEVYAKFVSSSLTLQRETLHVGDDEGRLALIDTRNTGSGDEPAQLMRYQYSNHLQTATLELDDSAAIISYEEYYPYGSTSFQSGRSLAEVSLKRYRYTGKERDEESGFYYHGARYYVPWLGRWMAVDPINQDYYNLQKGYGKNNKRELLELTASSYEYCYDNPITFIDKKGEFANFALGFFVGFAVDIATQVAVNVALGKDPSDIDLADAFVSGVAGALSSGLSAEATIGKAITQIATATGIKGTVIKTGLNVVLTAGEAGFKASVDLKFKTDKGESYHLQTIFGTKEADAYTSGNKKDMGDAAVDFFADITTTTVKNGISSKLVRHVNKELTKEEKMAYIKFMRGARGSKGRAKYKLQYEQAGENIKINETTIEGFTGATVDGLTDTPKDKVKKHIKNRHHKDSSSSQPEISKKRPEMIIKPFYKD